MTPQHTPTQLRAGLALTLAVCESIREAREIPSGTLYASLMGKVDFEGYQKLLRILTGAGIIEVIPSHLIRWTGPEVTK